MRLRHITGSENYVAASPYVVQAPEKNRNSWRKYFGNDHPIHVEIGMGKGQFILALAKQHPEINYIGIERYDTVLFKALKKREKLEAEEKLSNVVFISIDARLLGDVFGPEEIDRIYLNFSDPWPKDRHQNRRLTSPVFMKYYESCLKKNGRLEFKTDNQELFSYSVTAIPEAGWVISQITRDLHHDAEMCAGNVMTEYEEKFSQKGNPICKLIAVPGVGQASPDTDSDPDPEK